MHQDIHSIRTNERKTFPTASCICLLFVLFIAPVWAFADSLGNSIIRFGPPATQDNTNRDFEFSTQLFVQTESHAPMPNDTPVKLCNGKQYSAETHTCCNDNEICEPGEKCCDTAGTNRQGACIPEEFPCCNEHQKFCTCERVVDTPALDPNLPMGTLRQTFLACYAKEKECCSNAICESFRSCGPGKCCGSYSRCLLNGSNPFMGPECCKIDKICDGMCCGEDEICHYEEETHYSPDGKTSTYPTGVCIKAL